MSDDFDKYLAIANDDIQRANDYGQLKSYVASILYDHDKKTELLQQKENIIKEVREYIKEACWLDEVNKPNSLGHKQTMKVLEILDREVD